MIAKLDVSRRKQIVEECKKNANRYILITLHESKVQVDRISQHTTNTLNLLEKKLIGIGEDFMYRKPKAQAL